MGWNAPKGRYSIPTKQAALSGLGKASRESASASEKQPRDNLDFSERKRDPARRRGIPSSHSAAAWAPNCLARRRLPSQAKATAGGQLEVRTGNTRVAGFARTLRAVREEKEEARKETFTA